MEGRHAFLRQFVPLSPLAVAHRRSDASGDRIILIYRLTLLALTAAGLLVSEASRAQDIVVGVAAPLTGPVAAFGRQVAEGAEAAVSDANDKGGVLGRKLRLVTVDDGCNPAMAVQVAERLLREKAAAVIGHACASASIAASNVYHQGGVLQISPITTDPALTENAARSGWENVFRMAGRDDHLASLARYYIARRFPRQRIAIVSENSPFGTRLSEGLHKDLQVRGLSIVFDGKVEYEKPDLAALSSSLALDKPSLIYFAGANPTTAGRLIREIRSKGTDATFFMATSLTTQNFLDTSGASGNGALTIAMKDPILMDGAQPVISRLKRRGIDASAVTLYSYAATQVFVDAARKAPSLKVGDLSRALRSSLYGTVLGVVKFDAKGDRLDPVYGLYEVRNGKYVALEFAGREGPARDGAVAADGAASAPPAPSSPGPADSSGAAASSPVVGLPPPQQPQAYWNAWIQRGSTVVGGSLNPGQLYKFSLDLASIEYQKLDARFPSSTAPDSTLQTLLNTYTDKTTTFIIRPVLLGGNITYAAGYQDMMPVDLDRLRDVQRTARIAADYVAKRVDFDTFEAGARGGHFELYFNAMTPGCAAIGISVWHENGIYPLDYVVHSFAIGGAAAGSCETGTAGRQGTTSGLAALLQTSLSRTAAGPSRAAAALEIFETSNMGDVAVFVDGSNPAAPVVYGWNLVSSLSEYLARPGEIDVQIAAARDKAGKGDPMAYSGVADELSKILFSAKSGDQALLAKAALQKLVSSSTKAPVIVTRVISNGHSLANDKSLFLPLNLLAARSNDPVLTKQIVVVQPLVHERFNSADRCIGPWTFAIPDRLEQSPPAVALPVTLNRYSASWLRGWLGQFSLFLSYLKDANPTPSPNAEGLLILAHQDSGFLWYDLSYNRAAVQDISRTYPPGSVAILAACSLANKQNGVGLLERFNEKGMDALIASPFAVPLPYGIRLSTILTAILQEQKQNGLRPTLAELFMMATQRTAKDLHDNSGGFYEEMGLEYILLGDQNLTLCP